MVMRIADSRSRRVLIALAGAGLAACLAACGSSENSADGSASTGSGGHAAGGASGTGGSGTGGHTGAGGNGAGTGGLMGAGGALGSGGNGSGGSPGTGGRGTGGSGGAASCAGTTCSSSDVCVRTQTQGGPCFRPADGGDCPPGMTFSGVCCVGIPTFACAPRPPACGATLTCACAMSALCQPGVTCSTPSQTEIDCTLLEP
jgi:hypothetical protein